MVLAQFCAGSEPISSQQVYFLDLAWNQPPPRTRPAPCWFGVVWFMHVLTVQLRAGLTSLHRAHGGKSNQWADPLFLLGPLRRIESGQIKLSPMAQQLKRRLGIHLLRS